MLDRFRGGVGARRPERPDAKGPGSEIARWRTGQGSSDHQADRPCGPFHWPGSSKLPSGSFSWRLAGHGCRCPLIAGSSRSDGRQPDNVGARRGPHRRGSPSSDDILRAPSPSAATQLRGAPPAPRSRARVPIRSGRRLLPCRPLPFGVRHLPRPRHMPTKSALPETTA